MKKMMKLIALALVLTLSIAMLTSCDAPNADPQKAFEALEKNGYIAVHDESNFSSLLEGIDVNGVTDVVSAYRRIGIDIDSITIIYFEDADAANAAWENVKKALGEDAEDSYYVVDKSGRMIWFGDKDAVNDAK